MMHASIFTRVRPPARHSLLSSHLVHALTHVRANRRSPDPPIRARRQTSERPARARSPSIRSLDGGRATRVPHLLFLPIPHAHSQRLRLGERASLTALRASRKNPRPSIARVPRQSRRPSRRVVVVVVAIAIASTGRARIVPSRRHRVVSRTLTTLHRPTRIVSIARVLSRVSTRRRRVVVVAFVRSSRVVPPRVVVASSSFATVSARRRVSRGGRSTESIVSRPSRRASRRRDVDVDARASMCVECDDSSSGAGTRPGRVRDGTRTTTARGVDVDEARRGEARVVLVRISSVRGFESVRGRSLGAARRRLARLADGRRRRRRRRRRRLAERSRSRDVRGGDEFVETRG